MKKITLKELCEINDRIVMFYYDDGEYRTEGSDFVLKYAGEKNKSYYKDEDSYYYEYLDLYLGDSIKENKPLFFDWLEPETFIDIKDWECYKREDYYIESYLLYEKQDLQKLLKEYYEKANIDNKTTLNYQMIDILEQLLEQEKTLD